jgi:hypothetical protein
MQTYLGPPDALRVDHGAKFMAKDFRGAAAAEGISILPAQIECPTNMTHVERYHGPLRTAFEIRCSGEITDEEALEAAMKAVYDTVNPEGLVPTALCLWCIPTLCGNSSRCQTDSNNACNRGCACSYSESICQVKDSIRTQNFEESYTRRASRFKINESWRYFLRIPTARKEMGSV